MDSKVLEKINEVAKVLGGRIYFLIGRGWEGGRFAVFTGSTRVTESGQLNAESPHVIRLGAGLMIMAFATVGRDDEEQKAWGQTVSVCSGSSRTMSLFSVPGTVYPTSVRAGIVLYCNQFALFLLH